MPRWVGSGRHSSRDMGGAFEEQLHEWHEPSIGEGDRRPPESSERQHQMPQVDYFRQEHLYTPLKHDNSRKEHTHQMLEGTV